MNQFDNVEFEIQVNDSPTNIGKVLGGDFMLSSWGFPVIDADPGLFNSAFSKSTANYSKYNNADVDAKILEARATNDLETRKSLYQEVFGQLAEDLPYYPYIENHNTYVMSPDLHGTQLYEDGILRVDLLWKSA